MRLGVLCGLAFCAYGTAQADSVPDSAEQSRIVALVRQYAAAYQTPDVAFDRTITEFRENEGSVKWRKTFTLYSNRFAHQGVEYWRAAQKDGKPSSGGRWKRAGYPREHDSFEAMLKSTLIWDKWDVLRGRRTAVLTYRVLQRDSINALNLCIRDCKDDPAYVPYSGSLYVDPATGSIWRLSEVVDAPAARLPFRNSLLICDFERVTISNEAYMVATSSFMIFRSRNGMVRDVFSDANFHKFAADSSVTFEK